jgi:hypothetical protein
MLAPSVVTAAVSESAGNLAAMERLLMAIERLLHATVRCDVAMASDGAVTSRVDRDVVLQLLNSRWGPLSTNPETFGDWRALICK